jgi:hypothetical protein
MLPVSITSKVFWAKEKYATNIATMVEKVFLMSWLIYTLRILRIY